MGAGPKVTADLKNISISEDFLEGQIQRRDADTTHESFIMRRSRHSSVPQTATGRSGQVAGQVGGYHNASGQKRNLPRGRLMSVRLNKSQIDKAAKDKSGKFSEKFSVTLFLVRPSD